MSIDYSSISLHQLMRQVVTNGSMDLVEPRGGQVLWKDLALIDGDLIADRSVLARPNIRSGQPASMTPAFWRGPLRAELVGTQSGLYPHLKTKTIEYAWNNKITQLATDTTLAAAPLYTTESKTIYIPENIDRRFLSVRLVASYRSEFIATNTITGWRMNITLGGAAVSTFDRSSITAQSTASRNIYDVIDYECSDYFNSNFGSGTSKTCTAGLAVSTTSIEHLNNLTFRLVVTYAFDPNGANTRIKTVRIPIHGMAAQLTASQVEVGTDGVIPAPANQIPALTSGGLLPESSPTIRQVFLEITSNDSNVSGTTAITPFVQIDATAEVARATLDMTLAPSMLTYSDNYDLTGLIDYTVAHAFSMRSSVASRMSGVCAVLYATYEYDHSSTTTALYSVLLPTRLMGSAGSGFFEIPNVAQISAVAGSFVSLPDAARCTAVLDIQEPGAITLKQSAFVTIVNNCSNGGTSSAVLVGHQEAAFSGPRITTNTDPGATGLTQYMTVMHRADSAIGTGGWSLARGLNFLVGVNAQAAPMREFGHFMIVNYTAGVRSDVDNGNHTVNFHGKTYPIVAVTNVSISPEEGETKFPTLQTPYRLLGAWWDAYTRLSGCLIPRPAFMSLDGEPFTTSFGQGIIRMSSNQFSSAINQSAHGIVTLESFNKDSLRASAMDITKPRRTILTASSLALYSVSTWLTVHHHAFTVTGTVTINGSPALDGATIKVYADDTTPGQTGPDLVTTTTITGGAGAFTCTVPDNTRSYWAAYDDGTNAGKSLLGAPV